MGKGGITRGGGRRGWSEQLNDGIRGRSRWRFRVCRRTPRWALAPPRFAHRSPGSQHRRDFHLHPPSHEVSTPPTYHGEPRALALSRYSPTGLRRAGMRYSPGAPPTISIRDDAYISTRRRSPISLRRHAHGGACRRPAEPELHPCIAALDREEKSWKERKMGNEIDGKPNGEETLNSVGGSWSQNPTWWAWALSEMDDR